MKYLPNAVLALILTATAGPLAAGSDSVLVEMFRWWNETMKVEGGFTREGFDRYFTEDAAIIVNAKERVRGTGPMIEHFSRIQAATESVEIVLPFEEEFESGDRIFTYHLIRARENGVDRTSHIMGYAVIEDGRIALVNFLNYTEPATSD